MKMTKDPGLWHLALAGDCAMAYVDSADANMVPRTALRADHVLEETWNGWARPIATAATLHGTRGEVAEVEDVPRYDDAGGNELEFGNYGIRRGAVRPHRVGLGASANY